MPTKDEDFDALLDRIKEDDRARVEAERHAQLERTVRCKKLIAQDISPRVARAAVRPSTLPLSAGACGVAGLLARIGRGPTG
jgi:hypothetical protein